MILEGNTKDSMLTPGHRDRINSSQYEKANRNDIKSAI